MAKRSRPLRRPRLRGLYRTGDRRPPDPGAEIQRLVLHLPGRVLEWAQAQAVRKRVRSLSEYCAKLLQQAIEDERARLQIEDAEARQGPLIGLRAIAEDPEYLAEWSAQALGRDRSGSGSAPAPAPLVIPEPSSPPTSPAIGPPNASPTAPLASSPTPAPAFSPPTTTDESIIVPPLSPSAEIVLRHAGMGPDDPSAFLPTLRRGEPIGPPVAQELLHALENLESEHRDATHMHRRLACALHCLAFYGQVLLTDAWPGVFDDETIHALRLVQQAVDRIFSGEDIRYAESGPDTGPEGLP